MEDLIKRIEAADGPVRELDEDIALSLGIVMKRLKRGEWEYPDGTSNGLAPYTSSIDAAMTLVDAEDSWRLGHDGTGPDPSFFKAEVLAWTGDDSEFFSGSASAPALALCAAALRARNG